MNDKLASVPHRAAPPGVFAQPAELPRRRYGLARLRNLIATWRKRRRFRRDLEDMSKTNPHLIEDIGLTWLQAEAEIAKRFWQR